MKIIHLNYYDALGGAARAAYRIHNSLLNTGVESRMWVNKSITTDAYIENADSLGIKTPHLLRRLLVLPIVNFLKTQNPIIHSPSILSSKWPDKINSSDIDLVHLHWVQGEMLSVSDIEKIKKPVIWTLHDMWGFCGAEHYTEDYRWQKGYTKLNRPTYESGFDLNLWTWRRKNKYWLEPKQIVTPSKWLEGCVQKSALMHNWPVSSVPNPLNTKRWHPFDKVLSRKKLQLPLDKKLVLFGSMGGGNEPRKGFDLLVDAMDLLSKTPTTDNHGIELVIFGKKIPLPAKNSYPIRFLGKLHGDEELCMLYSAADVLVVPSRQEVFGQTASEAHACGTPVVAFKVGGLAGIVQHRETGYLADPFDTKDFANGISWLFTNENIAGIAKNARSHAKATFSESVIADKYNSIYRKVLQCS